MAAHPRVIVLLDGRRLTVQQVHYQVDRTRWRVSWLDGHAKGGLAERVGEEFHEVAREDRPA